MGPLGDLSLPVPSQKSVERPRATGRGDRVERMLAGGMAVLLIAQLGLIVWSWV